MTNNSKLQMDTLAPPVSSMVRWIRVMYLFIAAIFAAGIVLQVFFAGAGVLVDPRYFSLHSTFAHLIEFLPVLMLLLGLLGRLPWKLIALTLLMFFLFMLQYVFLYGVGQLTGMPVLRALHAVNALVLFWVALSLTQRTWHIIRSSQRRLQRQVVGSAV